MIWVGSFWGMVEGLIWSWTERRFRLVTNKRMHNYIRKA